MNLEDIGWNEYFQRQLTTVELEGVKVGRVCRTPMGRAISVLTDVGEIRARLPGGDRVVEQAGIGDWVLVGLHELDNTIEKVLTRKNAITRKVAGKVYKEQVLGANIDIIFVVMGLDHDYNLRRLERYLFMVSAAHSKAVVVLNKADLVSGDVQEKVDEVQALVGDAPVHAVSAIETGGLGPIRQYMEKGVTISLVGSSGAGKSTIINTLLGEARQETFKVREKDSKGRHVTTMRELFLVPGGGVLIDNPGLREIQLWGETDSLDDVFTDISELSRLCKFKDCKHVSEPGCAVLAAIDAEVAGFAQLPRKRYENYLKMRRELAHLHAKAGMSSEALERAKWRKVKKDTKHYLKYKRER